MIIIIIIITIIIFQRNDWWLWNFFISQMSKFTFTEPITEYSEYYEHKKFKAKNVN